MVLTRRSLFRYMGGTAFAFVAVPFLSKLASSTAITPLARLLTLEEIVATTLRNRRDKLVENMMAHNEILIEMRKSNVVATQSSNIEERL